MVFLRIWRDLRVLSKNEIKIMKNIFSGSDQNVFSTVVGFFYLFFGYGFKPYMFLSCFKKEKLELHYIIHIILFCTFGK